MLKKFLTALVLSSVLFGVGCLSLDTEKTTGVMPVKPWEKVNDETYFRDVSIGADIAHLRLWLSPRKTVHFTALMRCSVTIVDRRVISMSWQEGADSARVESCTGISFRVKLPHEAYQMMYPLPPSIDAVRVQVRGLPS